jgi:ComF family protein
MLAPAASAAARTALRGIVDFALPPRCASCGTITAEPHSLCLQCWQSLTFLGEPCCMRCGHPFEYGGGHDAECGRCLAEQPAFDKVRAAVAYGEVARKIALKLKYSGRPGIAVTLAGFMARHLRERESDDTVLIPVPLHRWRIWKRGYNQSALVASALSRRTSLPVALDLLRRSKATPPLRGLGRRDRALAVRGAFQLRDDAKPAVRGRKIILIDDVFTSGATADACARALKRAGAGQVDVLCWARVVGTEEI